MQREIVSTDEMRLEHASHRNFWLNFDVRSVYVGPKAMKEIADHCGIPGRYFARCLTEAPALAVMQVNHWFSVNPTDRMLEVDDGFLIGFKSPRQESRVTSPDSVV